jgi:hypothetical protein
VLYRRRTPHESEAQSVYIGPDYYPYYGSPITTATAITTITVGVIGTDTMGTTGIITTRTGIDAWEGASRAAPQRRAPRYQGRSWIRLP